VAGPATPAARWAAIEGWRDQHHWEPWRPQLDAGETETDCDDPDRLVVFDDLDGFLFPVVDSETQLELVLRFLEQLGVALPVRFPSHHPHSVDAWARLGTANSVFGAFYAVLLAQQQQQLPTADMTFPFATAVEGGAQVWGRCSPACASSVEAWARLFDSLTRGWAPAAAVTQPDKRRFIECVGGLFAPFYLFVVF
jgi:hypothetical protein